MDNTHPLEGDWLPTKAELDGEPAPALFLAQTILTLRDGHYQIDFGGETSDSGTYEPTDNAAFPALKMECTKGANDGRTVLAIFQTQGNRLRICFGLDGTLPDGFQTAADSNRYLVYYRRADAPDARS